MGLNISLCKPSIVGCGAGESCDKSDGSWGHLSKSLGQSCKAFYTEVLNEFERIRRNEKTEIQSKARRRSGDG